MAKLKHVPTVLELAEMGLATGHEPSKAGNPRWYKVAKKGYRLIREAQAHNAPILAAVEAEVAAARKPLLAAEAKRKKMFKKARTK
jgi:hypothetical protein